MARQKKAAGVRPKRRNQQKSKSGLSAEQIDELRDLEKLSNNPGVSANNGSVQTHVAWLRNTIIPVVQRQMMAVQIGQLAGNQYLQRVKLQREDAPDTEEEDEADTEQQIVMLMPASDSVLGDTMSLAQDSGILEKKAEDGTIQTSRLASTGSRVVQRQAETAAAMGAAEWIGLGAAGYAVAQDAVSSSAGDITWNLDEMEGVLLPGGGGDVADYRTRHPDANIRSYRHTVSVWAGHEDSRKAGIKFGISFNYDGHAIGNISCDVLDTYDWAFWSAAVNVNFTPLSLSRGDVAAIRITITVGADRTLRGGLVRNKILELDAGGTIRTISGDAWLRFGE